MNVYLQILTKAKRLLPFKEEEEKGRFWSTSVAGIIFILVWLLELDSICQFISSPLRVLSPLKTPSCYLSFVLTPGYALTFIDYKARIALKLLSLSDIAEPC